MGSLLSPSPPPTPQPVPAYVAPPAPALPPPPADPVTQAPIPVFTPPPDDPSVAAATQQANAASIASLQQTAQMDSASILARYGAQMSMANAQAGSPLLVR